MNTSGTVKREIAETSTFHGKTSSLHGMTSESHSVKQIPSTSVVTLPASVQTQTHIYPVMGNKSKHQNYQKTSALPSVVIPQHLASVNPHSSEIQQVLECLPSIQGMFPPHDDGSQHRLVHSDGNKLKTCAFCSINKVRTKSGWYVYTTFRCEACDVPLCKGVRDCFTQYHKYIGMPDVVDP